jgi:hypothetical protein
MNPTDKNFLTAAAINLYIESLRRGAGRVLLAPQDIDILYELIHILTNPVQVTIVPADSLRTRALTEKEQTEVLSAIEHPILKDLDTGEESELPIPESLRRH